MGIPPFKKKREKYFKIDIFLDNKFLKVRISVRLRISWHYPLRRDKTPPSERDILDITLNCIWWWISSSGYIFSEKYLFIVFTPRSNLIWNECPLQGSNRSFKKPFVSNTTVSLKNQLYNNIDMNIQWLWYPNLLA